MTGERSLASGLGPSLLATLLVVAAPLALLVAIATQSYLAIQKVLQDDPQAAVLNLVWVLVSILVLASLAASGYNYASNYRLPLFLGSLQRRYGRLLERSLFGTGSLSSWTRHNPDVLLDRIEQPSNVPSVLSLDLDRADTPGAQTASLQDQPTQESRDLARQRRAADRYVVERYDSFLSIAEKILGDGLRWREIRDLNAGLEMHDGGVIDIQTGELIPGWVILIPPTRVGSETA